MTRIASLFAAAMASLTPSALTVGSFTEPRYSYSPPKCKPRRNAGKHNPAGSKLARRAAAGTVGIARLR